MANSATKTQKREIDAFLLSVRGSDDEVLLQLSASTMTYASYFQSKGKDVYQMAEWIMDKEHMMFPLEIGQMIRAQQKTGATGSTAGLMVWLHSARSLLEPQLRLSGRELWGEINKATEESEELAAQMCMAMALPIDDLDHRKCPAGLEEIRR